MSTSRRWWRNVSLCGIAIAVLIAAESGVAARANLPSRLSDAEFWALINDASEPNGYFRSDNLVSDEAIFGQVVPDLLRRPRTGGAYLGVGPEQNFTYLAALESPMAFIVDIRRGNLHLQLLYKALFELSTDRADFLSKLFVKPQPAGLTPAATAEQLMRAYWQLPTSAKAVYQQHLAAVKDVLVARHHLPLSDDDLKGLEYVYYNFYWFGPSIRWDSSSGLGGRSSGLPAFADLIRQTDANGRELSFLSTEARFSFVKTLESKNLVVPIVGNFAGPKALRAIGQYLRDRGASVDAFYVSEVEPYLVQDGIWPKFCANLAALPVEDRSVLIRPAFAAFGAPGAVAGVPQTLLAAFATKQARLVPIKPEISSCRAGTNAAFSGWSW